MESEKKTPIGLKLCGNCNPALDIRQVLKALEEALPIRFISYEATGYEILLVISSCPVACARCINHGSILLHAEGFSFDGNQCENEAELARFIAKAIRIRLQTTKQE